MVGRLKPVFGQALFFPVHHFSSQPVPTPAKLVRLIENVCIRTIMNTVITNLPVYETILSCFNSHTTLNLTSSQLRQAADLKDKIEALEQQLAGLIGTGKQAQAPVEAAGPAKSARRTMSPAHKAKIRAAQQLRWAKHHVAKGEPAAQSAPAKPAKKGGMSAAGKARIAAAQKLRWAKFKAAKKA